MIREIQMNSLIRVAIMKIHKGDLVQIMKGKDRGKRGKILAVDVRNWKVIVGGLNLFKKHRRPKKAGEKGEVVSLPRPLNISNILRVCSNCDKAARSGYQLENGEKNLVCKKCHKKL